MAIPTSDLYVGFTPTRCYSNLEMRAKYEVSNYCNTSKEGLNRYKLLYFSHISCTCAIALALHMIEKHGSREQLTAFVTTDTRLTVTDLWLQPNGHLHIVICTTAFSLGIPDIHQIIRWGQK